LNLFATVVRSISIASSRSGCVGFAQNGTLSVALVGPDSDLVLSRRNLSRYLLNVAVVIFKNSRRVFLVEVQEDKLSSGNVTRSGGELKVLSVGSKSSSGDGRLQVVSVNH